VILSGLGRNVERGESGIARQKKFPLTVEYSQPGVPLHEDCHHRFTTRLAPADNLSAVFPEQCVHPWGGQNEFNIARDKCARRAVRSEPSPERSTRQGA